LWRDDPSTPIPISIPIPISMRIQRVASEEKRNIPPTYCSSGLMLFMNLKRSLSEVRTMVVSLPSMAL